MDNNGNRVEEVDDRRFIFVYINFDGKQIAMYFDYYSLYSHMIVKLFDGFDYGCDYCINYGFICLRHSHIHVNFESF